MNRKLWLCAGLMLATSVPALAQDDYDDADPTYTAIRITSAQADFGNLDSAINLGFTLGINIPPLAPYLAVEIDLSSTLVPGENSGAGAPGGGGGGLLGGGGGGGGGGGNTADSDDLRVNTVGLFAAARSGGKFFGSARVGYRFIESTITELNDESTGSAYGVGVGYRYASSSWLELTYTAYGSDLNLISFVINY